MTQPINVDDLPETIEGHPKPWHVCRRTNNHFDVFDFNNTFFAVVHCLDPDDVDVLFSKLLPAAQPIIDGRTS